MSLSRFAPSLVLAAGLALGVGVGGSPPRGAFRGLDSVRVFAAGDVAHLYRVPLEAGQFVRIAAEQRSADVILEVLAPGDDAPTAVDGRTYATGTDAFELVARTSGEARVRIVLGPGGGAAPGYRLTVSRPRPAGPVERLRAEAYAGFERAGSLPADEAIPLFQRALAAALRTGRRDLAAQIHDRLGRRSENDEVALRHFRAAAALAEEPQLAGQSHYKLGRVLIDRQRYDEAAAAFEKERRLGVGAGDRFQEAIGLDGLCILARSRGRFGEAIALEDRVLSIWRELGDRNKQADALWTLSILWLELGDAEESLRQSLAGLALDPVGALRIDLLDMSASAYRYLEDWEGMRRASDGAIAEARRQGDRPREVSCLLTVGAVALERNRLDEALRALKPAEAALRSEIDNPSQLANVEVMLGVAAMHQGRLGEALERIERSLAGYEALGQDNERAWVLSRRSDALREAGRMDEAQDDLEQAIAILESLRPGLEPQSRAALLANRHRFFERLVDLLVERKMPRAAFEASERSRARTLLDEVSGREVTPPRSLAEIQAALPADTVLIDYWLGETRSFVWTVRKTGLSFRTLPDQRTIVDRSRLAVRALGAPPGRLPTRESRISDLAETLFGAVADRLSGESFVVVPDGELFSVPFAALPVPGGGGGARLIDRGPVVTLPSASLALEIRDAVARRPSVGHGLFAVGDPVFGCPDDRLPCPRAEKPALTGLAAVAAWIQALLPGSAGRASTAAELPRIARTGSEVAAIRRLAGDSEVVLRVGFEANRSAVLASPLESFRILHFATHGLVDPVRPARSGLALARRSPGGAALAVDPFLRLRDLSGRRLRADLVVLSACDTALGRETRGEGPQSLGRAFLAAGAGNAVVSLWRVDDTSTEALMVEFYRQHLASGLPVAEALRRSQLAVRSRSAWSDPYYWGAFVVQGDWREHGP